MNEQHIDKIDAVIISCKSWDQLMIAYRWVCKVCPSYSDRVFSNCIMLNNKRGYK
jgi:hypothetical protein